MAIADRARDALRPTNSIERVPEPSFRGPSSTPPPGELPVAGREGKGKPPAYLSEPEAIAKRWYWQACLPDSFMFRCTRWLA